jgi:hypothetical protein
MQMVTTEIPSNMEFEKLKLQLPDTVITVTL